MTVCLTAQESDRSSVEELIFRCFPEDSEDFLHGVMRNIFSPDEALLMKTDGVISSAVLLPRFTLSDGRHFGYVYCLCTAYEFRGMGLMRKLLDQAEDLCSKRGDSFVALVPANEALAKTYSKMGYSPVTCTKLCGAAAEFSFDSRAKEEDIPLINDMYEKQFASVPHVVRSQELWKTLMALYSLDGGGIFLHDGGYLFAERHNDGYIIREAAGTKIPDGVGALLPSFKGTPRVFAKGYNGNSPLLNLLFD